MTELYKALLEHSQGWPFRIICSCICATRASWAVGKETVWPMTPKIPTIESFRKAFASPWVCLVDYLHIKPLQGKKRGFYPSVLWSSPPWGWRGQVLGKCSSGEPCPESQDILVTYSASKWEFRERKVSSFSILFLEGVG